MVLKAKEIREFTKEERYEKLEELKRDLMHETSIARMLTIMHEKGEQ